MATTKKGWLKDNGQPTQLGMFLAVMLALLAPVLIIGPVLVVLEVSGYNAWERKQFEQKAEERRLAKEAYEATPEGKAALAVKAIEQAKAQEESAEKQAKAQAEFKKFWATYGMEVKICLLCLGIGLLLGTGDRSMAGGCAGILLIIVSLIWLGC